MAGLPPTNTITELPYYRAMQQPPFGLSEVNTEFAVQEASVGCT